MRRHTCVRIHTHACPFAHTQGASHPLPCLSAKRGINTTPPTASSHVIEGKMGGEEKGSTDEYVEGRSRKAEEEGRIGECRARGQRVKEQGKMRADKINVQRAETNDSNI